MLSAVGDSPPGRWSEMDASCSRTLTGADDVGARLGVAAVAAGLKAGDPVALHTEYDSGHTQTEILPISTLV